MINSIGVFVAHGYAGITQRLSKPQICFCSVEARELFAALFVGVDLQCVLKIAGLFARTYTAPLTGGTVLSLVIAREGTIRFTDGAVATMLLFRWAILRKLKLGV